MSNQLRSITRHLDPQCRAYGLARIAERNANLEQSRRLADKELRDIRTLDDHHAKTSLRDS